MPALWEFRGAEVGAGTPGVEEGGAVPRVWVKWEGGAWPGAPPVPEVGSRAGRFFCPGQLSALSFLFGLDRSVLDMS